MGSVVAVVILFGLLSAALVLLTIAARGRWVRCEPRCARCSQPVGIHEVTESRRCPECGHALDAPGGVRVFDRRWRPWLTIVGAFLALFAFAAPILLVLLLRAAPGAGAMPVSQRSTGELIAAARSQQSVFELQELERRAAAGTLSDEELLAIVVALRTASSSADQRRAFPSAKQLLVIARRRGVLNDAEVVQLLDGWYSADEVLNMPRTVRDGSTLTLRSQHWEDATPLQTTLSLISLEIGGVPQTVRSFAPLPTNGTDLRPGAAVTIAAEPPSQELRAIVRRTMRFEPGTAVDPTAPGEGETPDGARSFTDERIFAFPIRVIAKDAPSFVKLESPEDREAEVRRACVVRAIAIDRDTSSGRCVIQADADLHPVPELHMAFDVILDLGGREVPLGWLTVRSKGDGSTMSRSLVRTPLDACPDVIPSVAIVRFVPAPRRVEGDPRAEAIWGDAIEIPNVPIRSNLTPTGAAP